VHPNLAQICAEESAKVLGRASIKRNPAASGRLEAAGEGLFVRLTRD
jgi:hypothetical protein